MDSLSSLNDSMAVICYHVSGSYQSAEALAREQFYASTDPIPHVIFDGTNVVFEQSPSAYKTRYVTAYNLARGVQPLFNLTILNTSAQQTTGSVDLRIVTADTIPQDEIVAFICITEDSLTGAFGTFVHVSRALYQFPVDLVYPDSLDTTIVFSHNFQPSLMKTVLFVQDMDTKEVLQATISSF